MSTSRKINKSLQLQNAKEREERREFRSMRFSVFTSAKLRGRRGYIGFPFRLPRQATPETVETGEVVNHRLPSGMEVEEQVRKAVPKKSRNLYVPHHGESEIARRQRQLHSLEQYAEVCGPGDRFLRNIERVYAAA